MAEFHPRVEVLRCVEYPDWHFNVRPSNTEPLLRLNLEATTSSTMAAKRDEVLELIRA